MIEPGKDNLSDIVPSMNFKVDANNDLTMNLTSLSQAQYSLKFESSGTHCLPIDEGMVETSYLFQGYCNFTTKLGYCYSTTWYSIHCQYDASNGDTIACRNSNSERRKFTEATFDMKLLDVHQTIKVVDIYERDSWETLVHMHISQVK